MGSQPVVKSPGSNRAIAHYAGLALLSSIAGIIFLTYLTLTYEGNDIAQAGILIGILGTVASGVLGFMSGIVLGRHFTETNEHKEAVDDPSGR